MKREVTVLGGMAGSSMDGLDLALIQFKNEKKWHFETLKCITYKYPENLFNRLKRASQQTRLDQQKLDIDFGVWVAGKIESFLKEVAQPELLAIHGHTVIHSPEKKISWQLGDGKAIANHTDISTITNFRTEDIKLGGQGAPLVPYGDFHLFDEYDSCINLGGIANVSIQSSKKAGDICPCNQVLNHYSEQLGFAFDDKGSLAKKGNLDRDFLLRLEQMPFFKKPFPKSLPNNSLSYSIIDAVSPITGLRSYSEFIARQVESSLKNIKKDKPKLLITGGGAFNTFLVSLIKEKLSKWEVVIPSDEIVSFKEAIIFAFLGLRRHRDQINVLGSVTGARQDTSSGVIHLPK